MSDIIDQAQYQAELILAKQIEQAKSKQTYQLSRSHCIDCDQPILVARQQAVVGCTRCTACQNKYETGVRHGR